MPFPEELEDIMPETRISDIETSLGHIIHGTARSAYESYESFIKAVMDKKKKNAVKKCYFCEKLLRQEHIKMTFKTVSDTYMCNDCDYVLQIFKNMYKYGQYKTIRKIYRFFIDYRNNLSSSKRIKVK